MTTAPDRYQRRSASRRLRVTFRRSRLAVATSLIGKFVPARQPWPSTLTNLSPLGCQQGSATRLGSARVVAPDHLIHFNGDRFFGPRQKKQMIRWPRVSRFRLVRVSRSNRKACRMFLRRRVLNLLGGGRIFS